MSVRAKACSERMREADILLANLAEQRTEVQLGMLLIWVHLCNVCSNKACVLRALL